MTRSNSLADSAPKSARATNYQRHQVDDKEPMVNRATDSNGLNLSLTPARVRLAERFLSGACQTMATLIAEHGRCTLAHRHTGLFETLVVSIIGQQLSTRAADAIELRLRGLAAQLTPEQIQNLSPESLCAVGLSSSKARCLSELSNRIVDGNLDLRRLRRVNQHEVVTTLTEIHGIGPWTAEMFLIFGLFRADVLSTGDAGLHRAVRSLFGPDVRLQEVSERWKPYRSVASYYLWKHLEV